MLAKAGWPLELTSNIKLTSTSERTPRIGKHSARLPRSRLTDDLQKAQQAQRTQHPLWRNLREVLSREPRYSELID